MVPLTAMVFHFDFSSSLQINVIFVLNAINPAPAASVDLQNSHLKHQTYLKKGVGLVNFLVSTHSKNFTFHLQLYFFHGSPFRCDRID